jgi:peptidoglycan hydrolase CwlO-like protein
LTRKLLSCIALLLCLLLLSPTVCLAFTISTDELNKLDSNLTQLQSINNQLVIDLQLSKQDLQTAKSESAQLKLQLTQLQTESTKAKNDLAQAQNSLATANGLLKKYEAETNAEIASLKLQRIGLIVGLLYFAIHK